MADISDKLTYLNETKGLIKKGLNDLGADLTDASSFRSYANVLSGMYDDYPKVTGEGVDLSLSPTKQGKLTITPKGSSSQFSTTGKNILNPTITSTTKNGVTLSYDSTTQEITLNGTCDTNNTTFSFTGQSNTIPANATAYSRIKYISGSSTGNLSLQIADSGFSKNVTCTTNSGLSADITNSKSYSSETVYINNRIRVDSGSSFTNLKFQVYLSTVDSEYELFTGKSPAPNPIYSYPVKSVTGENSIVISEQNLPEGYTQVDYIKSSGTQYINTSVKGNSGIRAISDFELLEFPSANTPLCGCYGNEQRCYLGIVQPSGKIGVSYVSTSWSDTNISLNTRYNLDITFNTGAQSMELDNVLIWSGTNSASLNTNNMNILLFGYGSGGSYDDRYPIKLKMYDYKLYEGDNLVRDYVPCYRNSDGKTGMYDVINDVFYPAQGTGEFEYGYLQTYEISLHGSNLIGLDTKQYPVDLKVGDKITIKNDSSSALQLQLFTNYGDTTRNDFWACQIGETRTITVANDSKAISWNNDIASGTAWVNLGETLLDYSPYFNIELNSSPDGAIRDEIIGSSAVSYNLFDKNSIINGYLNADGTITTSTTLSTSDFIEINSNETYYKTLSDSSRVKLYDENKNVISTSSIGDINNFGNAQSFTIPFENAKYIRVSLANTNIDTFQITEGSEAKPYFPYGQVGMWYKREYIHKKLYAGGGSTGGDFSRMESYGYGCRYYTDSSVLANSDRTLIWCNRLKGKQASLWNGEHGEGIQLGSTSSGVYLAMKLETLENYYGQTITSSNFKTAWESYFQNNETYIWYPLAQYNDIPITDTTLISQLNDLYDNGRSYDGTTNITSTYENGNEQMIIYAEALMDISDSTKVKVEEQNLTNIANTLRTKNMTSALYTPAQMPAAIETVGDMRDITNGIIEEYLATTGTIDANTFVEFVNTNEYTVGTDTEISSLGGSFAYAKAIKLSEDKVFIAHNSDIDNMYLNGIVCTINGDTITHGVDTVLVGTYGSCAYASPVTIDENTVFISHSSGDSNDGLNGIVCMIYGNVITPGTDTVLVSTAHSSQDSCAIPIFETHENWVLVTHYSSLANEKLNGIICRISGTTIAHNTDTVLTSNSYSSTNAVGVELSGGYVFVAHPNEAKVYGLVCSINTINGGSIYPGTDTAICNTAASWFNANMVKLDSSRVLITHSSGSENESLNAVACSISGATITPGVDTTLDSGTGSSSYSRPALLEEDKVFILHGSSYAGYLMAAVCSMSGTTITLLINNVLISEYFSADYNTPVVLDENTVFISHCTGGNVETMEDYSSLTLSALVYKVIKKVKESVNSIDGMTKEECTTTTAGDVWILEPYIEVNPAELM